jgi:sugar-specific transcriptional regulator TrmB
MNLSDLALLEEVGLTVYEQKTLHTVALLGVADAASLCREGDIPTSKIYRAAEKLAGLGLISIQESRPKLYAALAPDLVIERLAELARERAARFTARLEDLRQALVEMPGPVRGRKSFVDVALGVESHVKRHLTWLAGASSRILSYLERGDLVAIDQTIDAGFPLLRRVAKNATDRGVEHRVVFGFNYRSAPLLIDFLRRHRAVLRHLTGVRYSGELGHPFHVIDEEVVVLPLDHPFLPEGRFASLLIHDGELASRLAEGFDGLWRKAMRDLREIDVHPGGRRGP